MVRYEIIEWLSQGSMGSVCKAHDTLLGRTVALKILSCEIDPLMDVPAHFTHQVRLLAALQHPHIASMYDFVQQDGKLCLVTELVEGVHIQDIVSGRVSMSVAAMLRLVVQVCHALNYARTCGIIHGKLRRWNVLLTAERSPRSSGFGIAKMLNEVSAKSNVPCGIDWYMAPEQGNWSFPVTHKTDIYSAGVLLIELLLSSAPFHYMNLTKTWNEMLGSPALSISSVLPKLPANLQRTIDLAVAKNPADRYATAAEFASALEQCIADEKLDSR